MAFKRIIGTIFVKEGIVVKSYGFSNWRPNGNIKSTLKNLDRWQVDEILIIDISRNNYLNNDVIKQIEESNISTPLVYGGGIRSLEDVNKLMSIGCDRILIESLLISNKMELVKIYEQIGKQAIIGSLPLVKSGRDLFAWPNKKGKTILLDNAVNIINEAPVSEILIIDYLAEGYYGKFNKEIFESIQNHLTKIEKGVLWFGGINNKIAKYLLSQKITKGIAFGNILLEKEVEIPKIRKNLLQEQSDLLVRKTKIM